MLKTGGRTKDFVKYMRLCEGPKGRRRTGVRKENWGLCGGMEAVRRIGCCVQNYKEAVWWIGCLWRTGGCVEDNRVKIVDGVVDWRLTEQNEDRYTVSGVTNLNLNGQLQMYPVHHFLRRILAVGVWVQCIVSP